MTVEISANPILITFPPSLDCEMARFLLKLYQIDYLEKRHTLIFLLFNGTLASATAKFAYYHLLPYREIMVRPLSLGTPSFEAKTVEVAYGVYAGLLRTLLGLTAQKAQESLDQIRKIFDAVEARLAIQKNFLVGDGLTLSDVAFAVAAAPILLAPAYGGPLPSFEQMPPPMQAAIKEMRGRPAGAFALRVYDQHRGRS